MPKKSNGQPAEDFLAGGAGVRGCESFLVVESSGEGEC